MKWSIKQVEELTSEKENATREFNAEELKQIILQVEERIALYEKIFCNKYQIAEEKGWKPGMQIEIAHIATKIAELRRLLRKLYDYKS